MLRFRLLNMKILNYAIFTLQWYQARYSMVNVLTSVMYCVRCFGRAVQHNRRLCSVSRTSRTAMSSTSNPGLAMIYTDWSNKSDYIELLKERGLPVADASDMPEADWDKVTFATVWKPPPGLLAKCRNLRLVMSLGAGVDTLLAPGQVPEQLPITRIVDPLMAQRMATWVVWGVINWQRKLELYAQAQQRSEWNQHIEPRSNRDNHEVAVGIMGLGVMGVAAARYLHILGYKVSGWSRTNKNHQEHEQAGITCYAGFDKLEQFVRGQNVLVVLLPLTQETTGIINQQLLSLLPKGSAVINGGRGKQVVEQDLLDALDNGQLDFALLDVFDPEPLPKDSRLWTHPKVRITPHVASMTTLQTAADQIAANYHSLMAGKGPLPQNLVDRSRGY